MKYTILTILAISATINAQASANPKCAGTASQWCLKCVSNACITGYCANGYIKDSACTAPTTAKTNCSTYSGEATCSMCNPGYVLNGNACESPDTPDASYTGDKAKCAMFRGTGAAFFCTACALGKFVDGNASTAFATAGVVTIGACVDAVPTAVAPTATPDANCEYQTVSNAAGLATAGYTPACALCKAGYVKHTTTTACTSQTSTQSGCGEWDGTDCTACHITHQMAEPKICTAKPTTYSAILSVVSMIVALMFANF